MGSTNSTGLDGSPRKPEPDVFYAGAPNHDAPIPDWDGMPQEENVGYFNTRDMFHMGFALKWTDIYPYAYTEAKARLGRTPTRNDVMSIFNEIVYMEHSESRSMETILEEYAENHYWYLVEEQGESQK